MDSASNAQSFGSFLKSTKAHRNPEGDFIKDARGDEILQDFGKTQSWQEVEGYLYSQGACYEAVQAGKTVWARYRQWLRKGNLGAHS